MVWISVSDHKSVIVVVAETRGGANGTDAGLGYCETLHTSSLSTISNQCVAYFVAELRGGAAGGDAGVATGCGKAGGPRRPVAAPAAGLP